MTQYVLPDLPYDFAALEPHISANIMELHHDKHHKTYVDGANKALREARGGAQERGLLEASRPSSGRWRSTCPATCCTACSGRTSRRMAAASPRASWPRRSSATSAASTPSRSSSRRRPPRAWARAGARWCGIRISSRLLTAQIHDHQSEIARGQRAAAGARCLGARLLPAVPEREGEVLRRDLERVELGGRRAAASPRRSARR